VPGKAKRYTPEFKEQAARRVIDNSLPITQVARELGVNDTTLGQCRLVAALGRAAEAG
jgi:transposase